MSWTKIGLAHDFPSVGANGAILNRTRARCLDVDTQIPPSLREITRRRFREILPFSLESDSSVQNPSSDTLGIWPGIQAVSSAVHMHMPSFRNAKTSADQARNRSLRSGASVRGTFVGPLPPMDTVSLSCGPSGPPIGIPGSFSSSSLPPSLTPGRRTTVFTSGATP